MKKLEWNSECYSCSKAFKRGGCQNCGTHIAEVEQFVNRGVDWLHNQIALAL